MSKKKGNSRQVDSMNIEETNVEFEVFISDELKKNPLLYSGSLGTFGVGATLERRQLGRPGFPPGQVVEYPEATNEQYTQLAKTGDYERFGLYLVESQANSRRGDEG